MRAEKGGEGWGGGWATALAREVSARHPDFALIDVRAGIGVRLGGAWRGPWGGWAVRVARAMGCAPSSVIAGMSSMTELLAMTW